MRTRTQVSVGWGPAPPNLINHLLAVALAITSTLCAALDIKEYPGHRRLAPARPRAGAGWRRVVHRPAPGRAPRVGGFAKPHLGKRMAVRPGVDVRPQVEQMARMESPRRQPENLRRVRGQQRHRLAVRFRRQRHAALRPENRKVHRVQEQEPRNDSVRQILGRPGEVWLPELGADKLVVIREKVFGQYLGSE